MVLEELGLNYELIIKDHSGIDKDKNSPHQLSKFPTIEIIEQEQISILAETSAILDYLSHLHPQLGPNNLSSQQLQNFIIGKLLRGDIHSRFGTETNLSPNCKAYTFSNPFHS